MGQIANQMLIETLLKLGEKLKKEKVTVHLIRKDFQVTPTVKRYVNIYLIEGQNCYLIDSGVAGTESLVEEYLKSIGRTMADIKAIFLTHSHPDHIGAAKQIKKKSNCKVYAPKAEVSWIENIDEQFAKRPIPNFYSLVSESVKVDKQMADGDVIELEKGITIKCIETAGHSPGSFSFLLNKQKLFIGDALPVVTDLPIFVDYQKSMKSINLIRSLKGVKHFYPAWDDAYDEKQLDAVAAESMRMLQGLKQAAAEVMREKKADSSSDKITEVLTRAGLLQYAGNPLVAKSIEACLINEE